MPTIQKFNYSWPEGVVPTIFNDWVNELSPAERLEFDLAEARQNELRKPLEDQGALVVGDSIESPAHTWKDAEAAANKPKSDPVWERYYTRYLEETKTILTITYEEQ